MTREQAKQFLPVIQAWAEGKTIQFMFNGTWRDYADDGYPSFGDPKDYRIKPEPRRWWVCINKPTGNPIDAAKTPPDCFPANHDWVSVVEVL